MDQGDTLTISWLYNVGCLVEIKERKCCSIYSVKTDACTIRSEDEAKLERC